MKTYCRRCDEQHFDRAFALGIYAGPLAVSIIHLKSVPVIAPRLGRVVESTALTLPHAVKDPLIVPIPLSKRRFLERGFNQASVISKIVGRALMAEVDEHSLLRRLDTRMHRIAMDKKAREASVKNAFTVARPKLISGREIILVDDVLTTGSTASSCARALKESGAAGVNVLTLARAV
jgi:ComF family protein